MNASITHQFASQCLTRCDALAKHTEVPGQLTRGFLTPPMRAVHDDIANWMREARMSVRTDNAGNLIGTRLSANPNAKTLLIGSHLDTVPNAGKYDGMLGVVLGIAVVQSLGSAELPFAIEVIGFSEEEGVRFSTPYIGSRAVAGTFDPSWLEVKDSGGQSMRAVIEAFGFKPSEIPNARYSPDRVLGFIEAHIEQGPVLSRLKLPVAAVEAIAGQSRLKLVFRGRAGHAGTVPMVGRADALITAARLVVEVSTYGTSIDGLRATVGFLNVSPNARNVIPESVVLSLDIRHADDRVRLAAVKELCCRAVQFSRVDGVACEVIERQDQPASLMNSGLTEGLKSAMLASGVEPFSMVSGAGHDAVAMAECFPTAMLFLRQPSGVSHHPDEDVELVDVATAIEILTIFVHELAAKLESNEQALSGQRSDSFRQEDKNH